MTYVKGLLSNFPEELNITRNVSHSRQLMSRSLSNKNKSGTFNLKTHGSKLIVCDGLFLDINPNIYKEVV